MSDKTVLYIYIKIHRSAFRNFTRSHVKFRYVLTWRINKRTKFSFYSIIKLNNIIFSMYCLTSNSASFLNISFLLLQDFGKLWIELLFYHALILPFKQIIHLVRFTYNVFLHKTQENNKNSSVMGVMSKVAKNATDQTFIGALLHCDVRCLSGL